MANPYVLTSVNFTQQGTDIYKKFWDCLDNPVKHLKFGDKGAHISRLQDALKYAGGQTIDINEAGTFGASTKKAVHTYKSQHNPVIKSVNEKHVDSKCGAKTCEFLDREMTSWEAEKTAEYILNSAAYEILGTAGNILSNIQM